MVDIGEKIKLLRLELGMNQREVAALLNVSPSAISGYESRYRKPDADTIKRLAQIFDTSTDYLLGRSDDRYVTRTASENNWEESLLLAISVELTRLFTEYNEYRKTEGSLNLNKVLSYSIRGEFVNVLDKYKALISSLTNIREFDTMQEIDRLAEGFLNDLGEFRVGGWRNPDGSWTNSISNTEIELWLRDELEKAIPGYLDYKLMKIGEWIEKKKAELNNES